MLYKNVIFLIFYRELTVQSAAKKHNATVNLMFAIDIWTLLDFIPKFG